MKLEISKFKLAWKYLFGGAANVASYLLEMLNSALASIPEGGAANCQAVLNYTKKILSTLKAFQWLIPTKWQSAYEKTLEAVDAAADSLSDLQLTSEEIADVYDAVAAAVKAWKGEDDETCVDCVPDGDDEEPVCDNCTGKGSIENG